MPNKFKKGDIVIGLQWPDNIPAVVDECLNMSEPAEYPCIKISFNCNGKIKTAVIHEYRVEMYKR